MLWAWLSRSWRGWRSAIHIVKPETVIAWHQRGFRLFWTWKSRHGTGRPSVAHDVRALIREMSTANPLWGAPRIHGELHKLGISVSQSSDAKYMHRHRRPPSQTSRTFLANHASQIMATDLFIVPMVTFRLLFGLVLLGYERRRIVLVAVTMHPTAAWMAQQLRNAFQRTKRRDIYCTITIRSLRTSRRPSKDEYSGGAHGAAITVAERLCGARRLDPARVRTD
jgi:hypothetical protein